MLDKKGATSQEIQGVSSAGWLTAWLQTMSGRGKWIEGDSQVSGLTEKMTVSLPENEGVGADLGRGLRKEGEFS